MPAAVAESVGWVNDVLARLWPYMDQAVAKIAKESLEPAIQLAVPSALRGIVFERFTLGPTPIRVEGIRAVQPSPTMVMLLLDVAFHGTPDISLSVAGLHAGFRHLELSGRLALELTPLVNTMPIVAAVHTSFTSVPHLDFELTGVVAMCRLYGVLRQVMLDAIVASLVLPNRLTVKLGADNLPGRGDFFSLGYSRPRLLRLTVVEARNLKNADANAARQFFKADLSDPYAIVRLGAETFRTATVKDCLNPVWQARHEFLVHSDAQALDVYVFDEDHLDPDDELGNGQLAVPDIVQQGDVWLDIGYGSAVHLHGEFYTLEADAALLTNAPAGGTRGVLSVLVDQACQLPLAGHRSAIVRATVGHVTRATNPVALFRQVQKAVPGEHLTYETVEVPDCNPEWEQALELPIEDLRHTLHLQLLADRDVVLGEAVLPLEDLLGADGLTLRQQFDMGGGAGLFLTLHLSGLRRADGTALTVSRAGIEDASGDPDQWLSQVMDSCWKFLNEALETTLRQQVLPAIQSTLPFTVTCNAFQLGSPPPRLHRFRVGSTAGERGALLSFDVEYDSPCAIRLAAAGVPFGLRKLGFRGTANVVLQPLLGQPPLVGAVQVSFVNPPHLEMDFDGLANVLDWPLVGRAFRQGVRAQLQQFVLPCRTITHLADGSVWRNLFWELYEPPAGVLRVTVLGAKGLKNTDGGSLWSFVRTDVSDPYCLLSLGGDTYTTTTISNSLDPVWNDQKFDFVVAIAAQLLTVELYDDDVTNADDFLGRVVVNCGDLIAQPDVWLPLSDGPGQLHLSTEWFHLAGDRDALLSLLEHGGGPAQALLTVLVDQATALPTDGLATARVEVAVGDTKKATRALPLTRTITRDGQEMTEAQPCPEWEDSLLFLVPGLSMLAVHGTVLADQEVVGNFHITAADIVALSRPDCNAFALRKEFPLDGLLTTCNTAVTVTFTLAVLRQ
eukprot:GGOE01019884.1.p1 GENE.GGOE01019884.1~~GGOE01019884.1.p1  ORF type:complete len:963 (+),score=311.32 GGOE01019884.1:22-2889(+)